MVHLTVPPAPVVAALDFADFKHSYADKNFKFTSMVNHKGTLVAFAMDDQRRIYYAVLELENEKASAIDAKNWSPEYKELQFVNEIAQVGYGVADQTRMPLVRNADKVEMPSWDKLASGEVDLFWSSTARLGALAQFQVFSDGEYLYVFRKALAAGELGNTYATQSGGASDAEYSIGTVKAVATAARKPRLITVTLDGGIAGQATTGQLVRIGSAFLQIMKTAKPGATSLVLAPEMPPLDAGTEVEEQLADGSRNPLGLLAAGATVVSTATGFLPMQTPLRKALSRDTVLLVGGVRFVVTAAAKANAKKVAVLPQPALQAGATIYRQRRTVLGKLKAANAAGKNLRKLELLAPLEFLLPKDTHLRVTGADAAVIVTQDVFPGALRIPVRTSATAAFAKNAFVLWEPKLVRDEQGAFVPTVDRTLLADRFVLLADGDGHRLEPKREVRFQRSRSKTRPRSRKDSLGALDMDKKPFYEPTQELSYVRPIGVGGFSVLQLPTGGGEKRWQLFTHDAVYNQVNAYAIDTSADGLFNTKGKIYYTSPDEQYKRAVYAAEPGICPFTGKELIPIVAGTKSAVSLKFPPDGSYGEVNWGTGALDFSKGFTLEGWCNLETGGHVFCLFEVFGSNWTPLYRLKYEPSIDGIHFQADGGSSTQPLQLPGCFGATARNRWQHIAITTDGAGLCTLYLDGIPKAAVAGMDLFKGAQLNKMFIGGGETKLRTAHLGELRIWNYARSRKELNAYMSLRAKGTEHGLVGCWPLNEGTGAVARDISDSRLDISLINTIWDAEQPRLRSDRNQGIQHFAFSVCNSQGMLTGLTAALYAQQEEAKTGHDAVKKPLKRSARVMVGLSETGGGTSVVDFPVTNAGHLTRLEGFYDVSKLLIGPQSPPAPVSEMHPLYTDLQGRTVYAGHFSKVPDTDNQSMVDMPLLMESADGQVALYGQKHAAAHNRMSSFRYSTKTGRAQYRMPATYDAHIGDLAEDLNGPIIRLAEALPFALPASAVLKIGGSEVNLKQAVAVKQQKIALNSAVQASKGTPVYILDAPRVIKGEDAMKARHIHFVARNPGARYNNMKITVTASKTDPENFCDLTFQPADAQSGIAASKGKYLKEIWPDLPREAARLVAVLNGVAAREKPAVAEVRWKAGDTTHVFLYPKRKIFKGAHLEIGDSVITMTKTIRLVGGNPEVYPVAASAITVARAGDPIVLTEKFLGTNNTVNTGVVVGTDGPYNIAKGDKMVLRSGTDTWEYTAPANSKAKTYKMPLSGAGKHMAERGKAVCLYLGYTAALAVGTGVVSLLVPGGNHLPNGIRFPKGAPVLLVGNDVVETKLAAAYDGTHFNTGQPQINIDPTNAPVDGNNFVRVMIPIGQLSEPLTYDAHQIKSENGMKYAIDTNTILYAGVFVMKPKSNAAAGATQIDVDPATIGLISVNGPTTLSIRKDIVVGHLEKDISFPMQDTVRYTWNAKGLPKGTPSMGDFDVLKIGKHLCTRGTSVAGTNKLMRLDVLDAFWIPEDHYDYKLPQAMGVDGKGKPLDLLPEFNLQQGSLYFKAGYERSTDLILPGTKSGANQKSPKVPMGWLMEQAGLSLNQKAAVKARAMQNLDFSRSLSPQGLARPLTMEAWVRVPGQLPAAPADLLRLRKGNDVLGLQLEGARSAVELSGLDLMVLHLDGYPFSDLGPYTLEFWIKLGGMQKNALDNISVPVLVMKDAKGAALSLEFKVEFVRRDIVDIYRYTSSVVLSHARDKRLTFSASYAASSTRNPFYPSDWTHVAIQMYGRTLTLLADGKQVATVGENSFGHVPGEAWFDGATLQIELGASPAVIPKGGVAMPPELVVGFDDIRLWEGVQKPDPHSLTRSQLAANRESLLGNWTFEGGQIVDLRARRKGGAYYRLLQMTKGATLTADTETEVDLPGALNYEVDNGTNVRIGSTVGVLTDDIDDDDDEMSLKWISGPKTFSAGMRAIIPYVDGYFGGNIHRPVPVARSNGDKYYLAAEVDGHAFRSSPMLTRGDEWVHHAITRIPSYGLHFDGRKGNYVDCGGKDKLSMQDMSIAIDFTLDDLRSWNGIFVQTDPNDPSGLDSGIGMGVSKDGNVQFFFGTDLNIYALATIQAVSANDLNRTVITRKTIEVTDWATGSARVRRFAQVSISINGQDCDVAGQNQFFYKPSKDAAPKSVMAVCKFSRFLNSSNPLLLGTYLMNNGMRGTIGRVRIWDRALSPDERAGIVPEIKDGLVFDWCFDEGQGDTTIDRAANEKATIHSAKWVNDPFPEHAKVNWYLNGSPEPTHLRTPFVGQTDGVVLDGSICNLDEVRIWDSLRTQEQILDNQFTPLKGEKDQLIAYYPMDDSTVKFLPDHSMRANNLWCQKSSGPPSPVGKDLPQIGPGYGSAALPLDQATLRARMAVAEYGDLQTDADGNMMGAYKRAYSYLTLEGGKAVWNLLTSYKVGNLFTEWVAQVQSNPQVVGYIEGAPPVPSENLTGSKLKKPPAVMNDYNNASAITFQQSENIHHVFSSSRASGNSFAANLLAQLGFGQKAEAGLVLAREIVNVKGYFGPKAHLNSSYSNVEEGQTSMGQNDAKDLSLDLIGSWENLGAAINPNVGRRFMALNEGLALVNSDTMDVFALRLEHNQALVAYRVRKSKIPTDVNLIPFPINPRYTKQGTLDGKVGVKKTGAVQCDPDYPMAANYGEYSYYKPTEAYAQKKAIEENVKTKSAKYEQEKYRFVGKNDSFDQIFGGIGAAFGQFGIRYKRPDAIHARSIANTYVWSSEGGLYAEATQTLDGIEDAHTGSVSLDFGLGLEGEFSAVVFGLAVSAKFGMDFGFQVHSTRLRQKSTDHAFGLNVTVNTERDLQTYVDPEDKQNQKDYAGRMNEGGGIYDKSGKPVLQAGKVDAYRFMSFYLEPSDTNYSMLFHKVIDPLWLAQSDDKHAVALRQVQHSAGNCWRIFHRVTFVSRVMAKVGEGATEMEKAAAEIDIDSNWELIQRLEPYVKDMKADYPAFVHAVRQAIRRTMPEMVPHTTAIVKLMCDYYQVYE